MACTCAHLHVHSEYSLLDGAAKIDALAERAAAFDQPALGLTDHGVMNGAVELHKACARHGIKPIFGCEVYYVDDRRRRGPGRVERNHLTLLAATDAGYRNLVKLSSAGFLEGLQRGKPAVDLECLSAHAEGVIALTGCLASRISQRLLEGREAQARAHLDELIGVFGPEQVYMELQSNGLVEQDRVNEGIVRLGAEVGRPLVGTADVHYLRREDHQHHAALLCVQTKSTLADPKLSFDTNEFYLRSGQEMEEAFAAWPQALATSLEIAERCNVELELGRHLIPSFQTPAGQPEAEYLRELVAQGLALRYGDPPSGRGSPARRLRAGRDRPDGLLGLLPDRVGLRALRQGERDRGRPRPRLGGGLDRGLRAVHHRRRSAALRPAVRALPQPRAGVHARHRHRLLGARARARDPLRDRQVRPRARGPDRHLRQDAPAGRHPRRGPGAGPRLRHRRPPGQADPRPDHGPLALVRGVPGPGPAAAPGGGRRAGVGTDRRGGAGTGGNRAQRLHPRRRGGHLRPRR